MNLSLVAIFLFVSCLKFATSATHDQLEDRVFKNKFIEAEKVKILNYLGLDRPPVINRKIKNISVLTSSLHTLIISEYG